MQKPLLAAHQTTHFLRTPAAAIPNLTQAAIVSCVLLCIFQMGRLLEVVANQMRGINSYNANLETALQVLCQSLLLACEPNSTTVARKRICTHACSIECIILCTCRVISNLMSYFFGSASIAVS